MRGNRNWDLLGIASLLSHSLKVAFDFGSNGTKGLIVCVWGGGGCACLYCAGVRRKGKEKEHAFGHVCKACCAELVFFFVFKKPLLPTAVGSRGVSRKACKSIPDPPAIAKWSGFETEAGALMEMNGGEWGLSLG